LAGTIAQFYNAKAPVIWMQEKVDAVSPRVRNYTNDNYIISFTEIELTP
jgi:hypothetical protein